MVLQAVRNVNPSFTLMGRFVRDAGKLCLAVLSAVAKANARSAPAISLKYRILEAVFAVVNLLLCQSTLKEAVFAKMAIG